jgi:hypothetical protein
MKQFTSEEFDLLYISVITRIQRVELLIDAFTEEEDAYMKSRYQEELNQLTNLKKELNEIK